MPGESNKTIYEECIDREIKNALQGYNTSILVYGVTGSGKTHTVFGSLGYRDSANTDELGLVYYGFKRLVEEKGCSVGLSYMEVYNEQVKDLLGEEDNLLLTENADGDVIVQGLSYRPVDTFEQMINCIKAGNNRRKVAQTMVNVFSSRSHAILQLIVKKKSGQTISVSKLSFIDLAGSERVDLTQNRGARLNEGSNINKSLFALGKVISKLSEGNSLSFVPYRDSKLTRLLKDSLGGNTRTVLITCISLHKLQADETIHSLNYASRARNIKLQVKANKYEEVGLNVNLANTGSRATERNKERNESSSRRWDSDCFRVICELN